MELVDTMNFSLNVSCDAGGVHCRIAMLIFLPPIATEDYRRTIQLTEDYAILTDGDGSDPTHACHTSAPRATRDKNTSSQIHSLSRPLSSVWPWFCSSFARVCPFLPSPWSSLRLSLSVEIVLTALFLYTSS